MSESLSSPSVLLSNELTQFCRSESLSEDGLRELIERHGLTPNNDNALASNYEFFHNACSNPRVTEGIIRCLLEYFPDGASAADEDGASPLHYACVNKSMTRGIIQLLIDAAPDSVGSVDIDGQMPLHFLCLNKMIEEMKAVEILELFIEKCPEAVQHANNEGILPIHIAAGLKSPECCRVLMEAYPGSEQISDAKGILPFNFACLMNRFSTVQYLYKLYPDAINHASTDGFYPIHSAIIGLIYRDNPAVMEIVRFLLDCDPNVKLQKFQGEFLLHYTCKQSYKYSIIDVALEVIKMIYDALPEAIDENRIVSNIQRYQQQVQAFINSELVYARQAKDLRQMNTPDDNGQLPLHTALQNNVRLGSIKLLVKGNPSALRTSDNNFAMPLHIACEHHDTASIVQYLLDLDRRTLRAVDIDNNTALHYACRGAKYETIALLLDKYDATSVSKRNAQNKLPIDLLWESHGDCDSESVEYTESVFRLLRAHPETLMNYNGTMNHTWYTR